MEQDIASIGKIGFGVMSREEIIKLSVVKIFSSKLSGPNSIYDEMMGPMENNKFCQCCDKDNKECPGHFGYIELNHKIIHPLYYKTVISFLKCFCKVCSRCLINEDQLRLRNLLRFTKETRFTKILELCEKIDICPFEDCRNPQPKIILVTSESNIYMVHKKKSESVRTQLIEGEIQSIFDNIPSEHVKLLGLDPDYIHPKNLIISALPVLPPIARPYIQADNMTCDDDLTIQYLEIIKTNNHLENPLLPESKILKNIQSLKFRIKCLFDNSQEKAKHTNGRPMKGIKKRLAGKEGQIRNNLMGKRVNKSGRTVIGPDPTLRVQEIALPKEMANILTYPIRVNKYNFDILTKLANSGQASFVIRNQGKTRINLKYATFRKGTELLYGDIVIREKNETVYKYTININNSFLNLEPGDKIIRNKVLLKSIKYPEKKVFNLQYGDIVERFLQDGDVVLLNRQPTLHQGSMIAKIIKIRPAKTIRMNLATTKSYNADFDGDEMNIHVPNTPESEAELRILSATRSKLISHQSSKPSIVIVQDALLGSYLMTKSTINLSRANFLNIANKGWGWSVNFILNKIKNIRQILKKKGKKIEVFTGKGLFSLLLPDDLIYEKKTNADLNEPVLKFIKVFFMKVW